MDNCIRGDPKVAAKYQWRQETGFFEDVADESDTDSDDDFDAEFTSILHGRLHATAESVTNVNVAPVSVCEKKESKKNQKLDNAYYDMPDLNNLSLLCIDSLELAPFATVFQHYDALLMLKPVPNVPYLDMDTMLFTENKTLLGTIYELMGLVNDPLYNIMFPNAAECSKVPVGTMVYYAPTADSNVTKLLFLDTLRNNSYWKNDEADSDNEEEDNEESRYYAVLRKQLEDYEKRKRGHKDSSSERNSSVSGPRQPKVPRRDNPTSSHMQLPPGYGYPPAPYPGNMPQRTFAGFVPTAYPPNFAQPIPNNPFGFTVPHPPPPPRK